MAAGRHENRNTNRRTNRTAHRRASRPTNREVEIKLRVTDVQRMLRKLRSLGARYGGRVLEQNTLYDTPDSDFRNRGRLLRVRVETPAPEPDVVPLPRARKIPPTRTILTAKAPARRTSAGPLRYKEKLERELIVSTPRRCHQILRALGLRPGFRYEKFRTTFRLARLALELDETPAGAFLELEGQPLAIDRAARALGFTPRDYYRATYWDVYAAECRRLGRTPRNMLFPR
jgi:adenylate cyclase, class 2